MASEKPDKRVIKTKALIREAFLKCIETRGIRKTTVKEICDQAFIGRKTFYSHYETIDYLVNEILDEVCSFEKFSVAGTVKLLRIRHGDDKEGYYNEAYGYLEKLVSEIKKHAPVMKIFFNGKNLELEEIILHRSDKTLERYATHACPESRAIFELACVIINRERFEEFKFITLHPDVSDHDIIDFMLMSMDDHCHVVFENAMDISKISTHKTKTEG